MNKLNLNTVLMLENEQYQQKEVTIKVNGTDYSVKIKEQFKDTEIAELFNELYQRHMYCQKEGLNYDITSGLMALTIKHFTDIEFSTNGNLKDDFENEVQMLDALINLGIFEQVIQQFDKKEIEKMGKKMGEYSNTFKKLSKQASKKKK